MAKCRGALAAGRALTPCAAPQDGDVEAEGDEFQASPETDPNLERLLLWKAERTLKSSDSDGAAGRKVRGGTA